jgi:hypothetical protein
VTAALMNILSTDIGGWATPLGTNISAPTGSASTTGLMMGLGTTLSFTPLLTGTVQIVLLGMGTTATAATTFTIAGKYGTSTAPANQAAITGTTWGNGVNSAEGAGIGLRIGWSMAARITSLTLGTAYWFDVSLATANTSDTASIGNLTALINETL